MHDARSHAKTSLGHPDLAMLHDNDDLDLNQLVAFIAALANVNRLAIFRALADGGKPAKTLAEEIGISQSALSQHLAILRLRNLVERRRMAQHVFYSVRQDTGREMVVELCKLLTPKRPKLLAKPETRRVNDQGHALFSSP